MFDEHDAAGTGRATKRGLTHLLQDAAKREQALLKVRARFSWSLRHSVDMTTTQTAAEIGYLTVRLFDDGGVEIVFDVDDVHRTDLLAAAAGRLSSMQERLCDEERYPISCWTCGAMVTGMKAGLASDARLVPCGHDADWR